MGSASVAAQGLRAGRERVLIVTPSGVDGKGGIDRLNLYFASHVRGGADAGRFRFLGSRGQWRGPFWIAWFAFALARFAVLLASRRYRLAHIHVSTDGSAFRKCAFGWLARLFATPYVIHFHGDLASAMCERPPLWVRALGNLARGADGVIVLGEAFIAPFRDLLGVDPQRLRIVHNGIPDIGAGAVIPRRSDGPVEIVFTGEVGQRKGVDRLIEALALLRDAPTQWRCTIAGNGDLAPWRAEVAAAGLDRQVTFTGWLGVEDMRALVRRADIVVLPSRAEALPLSLIEGASAGAALVACDVGAVRDVVVDGVNGLIAGPDGADLARCLGDILANERGRAGMQVASRRIFLDRFHMERFVAAICDIYDETLARRAARG